MIRTAQDIENAVLDSRPMTMDEKIARLAELSDFIKKKEMALAKAVDRVKELESELAALRSEVGTYLK